MARRETVQALVLGRLAVGEADRLVTLFTRETGLRRVLAKGVRKIPSRRGGHLEPLTRVLAVLNAGRDYAYVAHVETADYYAALRRSAVALEQAQALARMAAKMLVPEEANANLFDSLATMWKALGSAPFPKQALLTVSAALAILRVGGVQPDLNVCQRCGVSKTSEAVILSNEEGGWHCLSCHGKLAGASVSLPAHLLPVLRYAAARPADAWRVRLSGEEGLQLLTAVRAYTHG